MKFSILSIFSIFIIAGSAQSQQQIAADKILAQINNRYITQFDINNYYTEFRDKNDSVDDSYKCEIMYDFIVQKILAEQAFRDSMYATPVEVESELDDRINSYLYEFGSKEAMEARLGKSVFQIKEEIRPVIEEQLSARRVQQTVFSTVVITPEEVKSFYNNIPKDKIPYINATVEFGEIIYNPKPSQEIEDYTKEQLESIRKEIVEKGRDFAVAAGLYSQDPGSRDKGGLMMAKKTELDPVFASAAFRLKNGEISPVIRSSFGYHIIQMVKRGSSEAELRHILLIPEITTYDLNAALTHMDSTRAKILADKMPYNEAVEKYSNDEISKSRGGIFFDFNTYDTKLTLDKLDQQALRTIQEMKVGEFSKAEIYQNPFKRGARAVRIIYLKDRIDPHTANLNDDYSMFQNLAKMEKAQKALKQFVTDKAETMFIKLDESYRTCDNLKEIGIKKQ